MSGRRIHVSSLPDPLPPDCSLSPASLQGQSCLGTCPPRLTRPRSQACQPQLAVPSVRSPLEGQLCLEFPEVLAPQQYLGSKPGCCQPQRQRLPPCKILKGKILGMGPAAGGQDSGVPHIPHVLLPSLALFIPLSRSPRLIGPPHRPQILGQPRPVSAPV